MANFLSNLTICLIFAAFFSTNFTLVASASEASNHTEPVVKHNPTLGESCPVNVTCHAANAVCISGHCLCPLGFTVVSDKNGTQSCATYNCNNSTTTNSTCALFGEAATCGPANTCQCIGPKNHVDEVAQECINFEAIQNKCTSDHQCGQNFRCNDHGKCKCKFGFTLKDFVCVQEKCIEDKDCQHFSSHAGCNNQTQTCQCNKPFELDDSSSPEKCSLRLKSVCASDGDCGQGAKCTSGQCSCPMGFVSEHVNGFNCRLYTCANDEACRSTFSTNSTMCRKKEKLCECFPPTKFRLDVKKQECVPLNEPPTCSSTCPANSECVSGSCQCKIGYYPTENGQCKLFSCNYYVDDCYEVFEHSSCSREKAENSVCVCKPLFKLNEFGTACESEKNLEFAYGVIGVGLIAFFGPIIFFTMRKMIC